MTGRIPGAGARGARRAGAGTRAKPVYYRRDRAFFAALRQILIAMGGPFVPVIPGEFGEFGEHEGYDGFDTLGEFDGFGEFDRFEDEWRGSGWSDPR